MDIPNAQKQKNQMPRIHRPATPRSPAGAESCAPKAVAVALQSPGFAREHRKTRRCVAMFHVKIASTPTPGLKQKGELGFCWSFSQALTRLPRSTRFGSRPEACERRPKRTPGSGQVFWSYPFWRVVLIGKPKGKQNVAPLGEPEKSHPKFVLQETQAKENESKSKTSPRDECSGLETLWTKTPWLHDVHHWPPPN